ncbi:hypothetical protein [Pseudomonas kribbensis]|uniref:Uncharacterized protein n=1 Tax=Pseudomonas kribbensis TaxID=1628086 RepID=A0A4Y8VMM8_9PSED|nr:hypothetical protein [Pseudomonas kribbensis]TFH81789.1 hypothetical protein E4J90_09420 [Pseudomonas kribbensis]
MSQANFSLERIDDAANSAHSAGYFIDAIGRLFFDLAGEDPDAVERILNGYTLGGIAAGLRIVGSDLMSRSDELKALLAKSDGRGMSK